VHAVVVVVVVVLLLLLLVKLMGWVAAGRTCRC
jgi:hypothetical protein